MDLKNIKTFEELKLVKSNFYKEGSPIKKLQEELKKASADKRAALGKSISDLKQEAELAFAKKAAQIEDAIVNEKIENEWEDVTLPGSQVGSLHPLTLIEERLRTWLVQNGYYEVTGSPIESDEYNFKRLNIPEEHPAREMQDSLYLNPTTLLRTHNTGFSARELEKNKNKAFSQFSIGPVFRNEEEDATHSHQFTQIDFVSVGYLSFSNLKSTLTSLLSFVLEDEVKIRLRPSFFPFTEPSAEVDVFYKGKWIEILGSGMLHDHVLKMAGYSNDMNGFAAGIGIERMAMIKYGINDLREFYRNDLRFINQFKGGR